MISGSGARTGHRIGQGLRLCVTATLTVLLLSWRDTPFTSGFPAEWPICLNGQAAAQAAPLTLSRIEANQNLAPAGQLRDAVLTLDLEIRDGDWYPEADTGPSVQVRAFAQAVQAPQIPGPLIRVRAGTEVHVTVRNALDETARVHGLHQRPGGANESIEIRPGEKRELRFKVTAPGTYHYWATTIADSLALRSFGDSQLSGALVVDPPGELAPNRIFVMGVWVKRATPGDPKNKTEQFAVINGKSWPHTEQLTYRVGEPVRWRVINASFVEHAMHLHGAYFRVLSEGDGEIDKACKRATKVGRHRPHEYRRDAVVRAVA